MCKAFYRFSDWLVVTYNAKHLYTESLACTLELQHYNPSALIRIHGAGDDDALSCNTSFRRKFYIFNYEANNSSSPVKWCLYKMHIFLHGGMVEGMEMYNGNNAYRATWWITEQILSLRAHWLLRAQWLLYLGKWIVFIWAIHNMHGY